MNPNFEFKKIMKATVHVTLKSGVLDPQGQAIHHAAETLGYQTLAGIRQGKYFEVEFRDGVSAEAAQAEVEKLAREILSNPVIEDFCVSFAQPSPHQDLSDDLEAGGHA